MPVFQFIHYSIKTFEVAVYTPDINNLRLSALPRSPFIAQRGSRIIACSSEKAGTKAVAKRHAAKSIYQSARDEESCSVES